MIDARADGPHRVLEVQRLAVAQRAALDVVLLGRHPGAARHRARSPRHPGSWECRRPGSRCRPCRCGAAHGACSASSGRPLTTSTSPPPVAVFTVAVPSPGSGGVMKRDTSAVAPSPLRLRWRMLGPRSRLAWVAPLTGSSLSRRPRPSSTTNALPPDAKARPWGRDAAGRFTVCTTARVEGLTMLMLAASLLVTQRRPSPATATAARRAAHGHFGHPGIGRGVDHADGVVVGIDHPQARRRPRAAFDGQGGRGARPARRGGRAANGLQEAAGGGAAVGRAGRQRDAVDARVGEHLGGGGGGRERGGGLPSPKFQL